jgi:starvation-inducible DNA-binding protein
MGHTHSSIPKRKLQAFCQPNIGLVGGDRYSVVKILNKSLANEEVLTLKTRSAYWHVRGQSFLDLRNTFDQQIHELNTISDHIAVRVRMLGGLALSSFEEFLKYTQLKEQPGEVPDISRLLTDHEASIRCLREDSSMCLKEYGDDGTYALLVRFIRLHEKMASALRTYIEPELTLNESQGNQV